MNKPAPKPDVKVIPVHLNNGAIHHLAQFLAVPGVLTDPADLFRAGAIMDTHLCDLPEPNDPPEGTNQIKAVAMVRAWQREGRHQLQLTPRQFDTCKKCLSEIIKKGIAANPATTCLLTEFGLAPEDG